MKKSLVFLGITVILLAWLSSCNQDLRTMNKYVKKGTIEERDSAAFFFYKKGNYEKASYLFEELMSLRRVGPRSEEYLYHYAYAKYKQGLFISSSYYFEQFTKQYPTSKHTEECAYMIAYCYYMQSTPYFLDQSFTDKALAQFQIFINLYPGSEKVSEANDLMSELRETKARKAYEQAKLYFKVSNFKASATAFQTVMRKYPDSRYREESQFLLFHSTYKLAEVSTDKKKKNRYLDALDYYERFVDRYPNSIHIKEAENIYEKTQKGLKKTLAIQNL